MLWNRIPYDLNPIQLNNEVIKMSHNVKNLEGIFDQNFSLNDHVVIINLIVPIYLFQLKSLKK